MILEPCGQRFDCTPVTELFRNIRDNQGSNVDVVRLKPADQPKLIHFLFRDPVVANQGVGEDQYLAPV